MDLTLQNEFTKGLIDTITLAECDNGEIKV